MDDTYAQAFSIVFSEHDGAQFDYAGWQFRKA